MAQDLHVGEIGKQIIVKTGEDLTGATAFAFLIKRPDDTLPVWTAALSGPATNGILTYTTVSGDLTVPGNYILQPRITYPAGLIYGDCIEIEVFALFDCEET
jgi:hypothetical protein